jgi:hypothetical protein
MEGGMGRLTPAMLNGLREMDENLKRWGTTMAVPNENTGRALESRGLIEVIGKSGKWNRYVLTPAGRQALEADDGR